MIHGENSLYLESVPESGDFFKVVAEKKEKDSAPQAPAGGRKGTEKGKEGKEGERKV